jgi:hypothetical protein
MTIATASQTRTTQGRFASPACPWGITTVLLPNWQLGYRVGEGGRIYASQAHAEAFAQKRRNRIVVAN